MDEILKDFYNSLKGGPTARSYKSGLNSLIKWYDAKIKNKKMSFETILNSTNNEETISLFFSFVQYHIYDGIRSYKQTKPNKETLYNYSSYLSAFEKYWINGKLRSITPKGKIAQKTIGEFKKSAEEVSYTKDELVNVFAGRLLIQDRISTQKPILFPIRLFRKIWSDDSVKWAKDCAKNIKIIIKDSTSYEEICLEEIDSLTISRGKSVEITRTIKGEEHQHQVFTSYSDPYENLHIVKNCIQYFRKRTPVKWLDSATMPETGIIIDSKQNVCDGKNKVIIWHVKPMKVQNLGEIVIDHDIPISLILEENKDILENLAKLSDIYKKISNDNELAITAKNANVFSRNYSDEFSKECQECKITSPDMEFLKESKLVLMQGDENGKKSDN